MDRDRFDRVARTMAGAAGSRRYALGAVAAGIAGSAAGTLLATGGAAKRKKKKKTSTLAVAYECAGPKEAETPQVGEIWRIGQVFTATRSGRLRQVRVGITKADQTGPGDYLVQVLTASGAPPVPDHGGLGVIAAAVIPDAAVPEGDSTLVATFGGTPLAAGTAYGVVVARPGASTFSVQVRFDDPCEGEEVSAAGTSPFLNIDEQDAVVTVLVD